MLKLEEDETSPQFLKGYWPKRLNPFGGDKITCSKSI
jgi:hypothetical protein